MAEEIVIDLNVNSTQSEKTLKKFGGTLEDVYGEGVQPLNFAIGELEDRLYEMAAAGNQGTQEFADMAKEVARMKKVIIQTDSAVDGLAEGVGVSLGGAVQGVAGGFALAQGVMGTFGANSEALEETLLKVQSAMAIADGIQSVREGQKAFKDLKVAAMSNVVVQKALNLVMSLNPIGLIIAGVVALGAAIYALWGPIKQFLQFLGIMEDDAIDVAAAHKKITAEYEAQLKAMKALQKQREADHAHEMKRLERRHKRMIETMEEEGASHEEITAEMRRQTEERFKAESEGLDNTQKDRKEEFNLNRDTLRKEQALYREAKRQGEDDRARELKDSINKKKEENEALLFEIRNHHKQVELLQEGHVDNLDEIDDNRAADEKQRQKEASDRYKAFLQDKEAARKQIEDLTNQAIQDETARAEAVALTKRDRDLAAVKGTAEQKAKLRELIEQDYQNTLTKIAEKGVKERQKLEEDAAKVLAKAKQDSAMEEENLSEIIRQAGQTDRQNEIDALNDYYFNLIETAKQHNLDVAALEQEQADKLAEIDKKAADEKKRLSEQDLANAAANADAKLQLNSDVLGAINGLVQAFAKEDERSARRAFKVNKAVGIAQAIISTAQGVIAQLAVPQDALTGANFVKAGIVATTGAAQIATIAKTEFKGASGGASSPSVTGVPSASAAAPTFGNIGDTGVNQLAQTLGQQGKQPVKAFVVSSDVTSAQSLDRKKIQNSTL